MTRLSIACAALALALPATASAETVTVMRYADDFARGTARRELVEVDAASRPRRERAAGVPRTAAVILFNFSDDTSQPLSAARAKEIVFTGAESAASFHREQSYGAVTFRGVVDPAGDVLGYYTIAATRQPCNVDLWADQASARATAAGHDLAAYDHLMFVFPDNFQEGCTFGGLGEVPGRNTWFHASQLDWAASHELGHNLGLHHANAYDCRNAAGTRVTFGGTCEEVEYGDRFDVMGRSQHRHANALRKVQLGLMETPTTITTEGVYRIAPIGDASGMRAVRILRDTVGGTPRYYSLEVRRSESRFDDFFCMDPAVKGVTLRLGVGDQSHLLDATPETDTFEDAPLAVGRTFTDATRGVSIRTLRVDAGGADVAISFGGELPEADPVAAPDPGVGGTGLLADYFGNRELVGEPLASVTAANIDFMWGEAAPAPGVPADDFSARFHGYLVPAESGEHVFSTSSDDGVRLWVNGEPLVDDWRDHGSEGNVGRVTLTAGEPAEILMEYYDGAVDAEARLAYQPPAGSCQIVPPGRLFLEPTSIDEEEDEEPVPSDEGGQRDLVGGCAAGGGGSGGGAATLVLLAATLAVARRRRM